MCSHYYRYCALSPRKCLDFFTEISQRGIIPITIDKSGPIHKGVKHYGN